jgi:hypothetical protein
LTSGRDGHNIHVLRSTREGYDMTTRTVTIRIALLLTVVSLTVAAAHVGSEYTDPQFEGPLLLTSAGQGPDAQLASVLARRAGIEHKLSNLATTADLTGVKSLGIVVGASLKGLGAAGIDTNREKERVRALVAEANRRNIPVLFFHLGGDQRRGQLTDEFISEYMPAARWALVVKSGNNDGLMTRISKERNIPLHEVERTVDGSEVLRAAFKSGN